MKLIIPKREYIINTSHGTEEDPIDHYYKPFLNYVYVKRLKLALPLLTKKDKVLEIGYGSGIFFPTLNNFYNEMHGIDIHKKNKEVENALQKLNIQTNLISADLLKMPYKNQTFDSIVSISTFEHIKEIDKAVQESARVLKPQGEIILGIPTKNILTDTFFNIVGKHEPVDVMHPTNQFDLIKAIKKHFNIIKIRKFPEFLPLNLCFYVCIKGIKK